jgi:hypothetical protein
MHVHKHMPETLYCTVTGTTILPGSDITFPQLQYPHMSHTHTGLEFATHNPTTNTPLHPADNEPNTPQPGRNTALQVHWGSDYAHFDAAHGTLVPASVAPKIVCHMPAGNWQFDLPTLLTNLHRSTQSRLLAAAAAARPAGKHSNYAATSWQYNMAVQYKVAAAHTQPLMRYCSC